MICPGSHLRAIFNIQDEQTVQQATADELPPGIESPDCSHNAERSRANMTW